MSDRRISIQIRMPVELHARLRDEAAARDLSANFLATKAVESYVARLIPPDEIQWTRTADANYIVAHHHHNPANPTHTIDHYSEERCGLDAFNIPRCYSVHAIGDTG